jgi:hypothetical protein
MCCGTSAATAREIAFGEYTLPFLFSGWAEEPGGPGPAVYLGDVQKLPTS